MSDPMIHPQPTFITFIPGRHPQPPSPKPEIIPDSVIEKLAENLADVPNEIFDICWLYVGSCPCKTFGALWNQKNRAQSVILGYSGYCVRCTGDICNQCSKQCRFFEKCSYCDGDECQLRYDGGREQQEQHLECQNTIGLCIDCRTALKKINPCSKERSDLCAKGFCAAFCGPCRAKGNGNCPTSCIHCKTIAPTSRQLRCGRCDAFPLCSDCSLGCDNAMPLNTRYDDYEPNDDNWKYHSTGETKFFCKMCGQKCKKCGAVECPTCSGSRCECGAEITCVSPSKTCDTCKRVRCEKCIVMAVYHTESCRERLVGFHGLIHRTLRYTCKYCFGKSPDSRFSLDKCDCAENV